MSSLSTVVENLNRLIINFQFFEALDKYYNEDVVVFENENKSHEGLSAYKLAAKRYLENISNHSATLKNVIISDDLSVCEWHYVFDHKEWGHWDKVQISVQRWKGGKIVHERHHYKT